MNGVSGSITGDHLVIFNPTLPPNIPAPIIRYLLVVKLYATHIRYPGSLSDRAGDSVSVASDRMRAAAPKCPHYECSSPLMGVGTTPYRVVPGQGGLSDCMHVLTQSSILSIVNGDGVLFPGPDKSEVFYMIKNPKLGEEPFLIISGIFTEGMTISNRVRASRDGDLFLIIRG